MRFSIIRSKSIFFWMVSSVMVLVLSSCGGMFSKNKEEQPLARVGEAFLYPSDVTPLLSNAVSKEDSASFVTNYINNWASKQLLLAKAKINLPEDKLTEFDKLVDNYRNDLYTRAYKEALVQQGSDSTVSKSQLREFYNKEKQNFRLNEKIVRLRFIELPKQFLNKDEVIEKLKRFNKEDVTYLDSIGVQFKKLNFNDSIWVRASRVIDEIPPLSRENEGRYLKKSQFFELEDAKGVYLTKIIDVLNPNDIAPLSFIEPTIKQVLLSRRKLDYIRKLETEIIDEAIKDKDFEVYAKD
ncbi:peptidyl-prolyl cis-trans isomerase [Flavobacteriaceae bacterium TP-CH-4]|uniref:Peptidyl-prolyl cis-trans isomerase n=1 Tax=Pelagihabitans pacificus TaxID=2696054 RepID=A0A967ARB3_9FLAO|nr:peptidyl-prolyl cis-trans isomerase [Pelagihabitans pacificus]NHF57775.1 peptidyl-prolyl cis-trans isomerase [Pelagihabitans pacificus]